MFKLKKSNIEIEINSPSELIAWAEEFKKDCERYQVNAKKIVDSKDTEKGCFVEVYYKIGSDLNIKISWKPKFEGYAVTNL